MKSIKDLREQYDLITEKEEHDMNKLSQLVRAGLFDAKKLSALKRAMEKPVDKMTAQEKRMMMNLLDSLMAEVLNDKQVYRKIKQDVMKESMSDWETKDYFSKNDPRFGRGFPKQSQMPSVLLLKRKGIRVFPDGQKIGLYYAQAIDKYVSIPFEGINISGHSVHEETQLNENALTDFIGGLSRILGGGGNNEGGGDEEESNKKGRKYLKPGESGKAKLNVGGPKEKEDDNRPDAIRSRTERLNRLANQAMVKNVQENFKSNLEVLREGGTGGRPPKGYVAPKIRPKAGIGPGNKPMPEKDVWDKLTDIKDDGTVKGFAKDMMPVVGTVRQAKRTSASYNQASDEFNKGHYWNATKGAADTAVQGGLTAISAVGDVLTATGIAAPVVTTVRGAVSAAKAARAASRVNKFLDTVKATPLKTAPAAKPVAALAAPEKPATSKSNISPEISRKIRNNSAADQAITRQTNVAAAISNAKQFRDMYPRAADTTAAKPAKAPETPKAPEIPATAKPSTPKMPKATAADRSSGKVQFKEPEKNTFKIAEPATSKGQLVPVRKEPTVSKAPEVPAIAPAKEKKSMLSFGTTPLSTNKTTVKTPAKTDSAVASKPTTSQQYQQAQQSKTQSKEEPSPKKDTPNTSRTKPAEPGPKKGFRIPPVGGLSLGLGKVDGKPLTPGPTKLTLNVSGPKREGDPSALASRQTSLERKVLKAQSSMNESLSLDGNLFELNTKAAKKVFALYESLNKKNKKKMIEMMKESDESLEKVISFAVRQ